MLVPIYKAQELVDYLLGSCYTIEDALVAVLEVESLDELENELEVLELIDRQIFRCEQCDWWWSEAERAVDNNCEGCYDFEEE